MNVKLKMVDRKSVCIVGSGVSGLIAQRILREDFNVTVYESSDRIGGLWNYSPETDENVDPSNLFYQLYGHSLYSMHKHLVVNLPGSVTKFSDFLDFTYSSEMCTIDEVWAYV
jgi:cation diffusion facilitator CzcD-associated flavoprotein CzcO